MGFSLKWPVTDGVLLFAAVDLLDGPEHPFLGAFEAIDHSLESLQF